MHDCFEYDQIDDESTGVELRGDGMFKLMISSTAPTSSSRILIYWRSDKVLPTIVSRHCEYSGHSNLWWHEAE